MTDDGDDDDADASLVARLAVVDLERMRARVLGDNGAAADFRLHSVCTCGNTLAGAGVGSAARLGIEVGIAFDSGMGIGVDIATGDVSLLP
jgi:hypothetical protein